MRGDIEQFVHRDAGVPRRDDIAYGVAAPAPGGQSDRRQFPDDGHHILQRHVVHLDFLSGGDVEPAGCETPGQFRDASQLPGCDDPCGAANADHETAGGALFIDPEGDPTGA